MAACRRRKERTPMLLIQNTHLIDPASRTDGIRDILTTGEKIIKIADRIDPEEASGLTILDAKGLTAIPGLVDALVHFRDPGFTWKEDIFMRRADTNRVLSETFINKLVHQGIDGRIIVGVSVAKEIQHLRSDVYSKDSLPLPLISAINPVIAGELATRGLDMANALNTGKQLA